MATERPAFGGPTVPAETKLKTRTMVQMQHPNDLVFQGLRRPAIETTRTNDSQRWTDARPDTISSRSFPELIHDHSPTRGLRVSRPIPDQFGDGFPTDQVAGPEPVDSSFPTGIWIKHPTRTLCESLIRRCPDLSGCSNRPIFSQRRAAVLSGRSKSRLKTAIS